MRENIWEFRLIFLKTKERDLNFIVERVNKLVAGWKGKNLFSIGEKGGPY